MNYLNSNNFKYLLDNSKILKFNDTFYNLSPTTSVIQCRRTISPAFSNYFDITIQKKADIHKHDIPAGEAPADTSTLISIIPLNTQWFDIWTVVGSLSFSTSNYSQITSTDSITISIQTITPDGGNIKTFPYRLYPQYVNCCQFVDHEPIDAFIQYINVYVTSTVPVTLMEPIRRGIKISTVYIDFISM